MGTATGQKLKLKGKKKNQKWQFVSADGKASKWHKGGLK